MNDYSLLIAERHVERYQNEREAPMEGHREAMAVLHGCEAFLESGIQAYKWLRRAEQVLQHAAREGFDVPESARDQLSVLYQRWLRSCSRANGMVEELKGYEVTNLSEFRDACEYVRRRVEKQQAYEDLDELLRGRGFDDTFWEQAAKMRTRTL